MQLRIIARTFTNTFAKWNLYEAQFANFYRKKILFLYLKKIFWRQNYFNSPFILYNIFEMHIFISFMLHCDFCKNILIVYIGIYLQIGVKYTNISKLQNYIWDILYLCIYRMIHNAMCCIIIMYVRRIIILFQNNSIQSTEVNLVYRIIWM